MACVLAGCSCGDDELGQSDSTGDGGAGAPSLGACESGAILCEGEVARICDGKGGIAERRDCAEDGARCMSSRYDAAGRLQVLGCVVCTPGETSCSDGQARLCREDGSGFDEFACDAIQGMVCETDGCKGACAPPQVTTSYIGCDYYPTVTLNPVYSGFDFAVAVANTDDETAHVVVTRLDATVSETTVPPGGLSVVKLPWVSALKGGDQDACQRPPDPGQTRIVRGGAFRLRSDRPVTVYQLSPLQYQLSEDGVAPAGCPVGTQCPGGLLAECLSFSNDATLLLPATALSGDYTVMSWPSRDNTASFYAVTALADDTRVTLHGAGTVTAGDGVMASGDGEVQLERGDVLQVVAQHGSAAGDVSGTRVAADRPVQVIGGHSCANVPDATTGACDHLEQAMFPSQILGKDYVVSYPAALASRSPYVVRLSAVEENTRITFDPPVHDPVTLQPGEVPFLLTLGHYKRGATAAEDVDEAPRDVHVVSDKPIVVAQYMQGQTSVPSGSGDPSLALSVPTEQYRLEYTFIASTSYDANFANVIAKTGTKLELDGQAVSAQRSPVGDSEYQVMRIELPAAAEGVHHIEGEQPFGLMVYGYGRFTSYMYPGGLDLKRIFVLPPE